MTKHEKRDLVGIAKAANEIGKSGQYILALVNEGLLTEYDGKRYSLSELRGLDMPAIRNVRCRVTG